MKLIAWALKGKVIGELPEHIWLIYEMRIGQWTMWLWTTSGILATHYKYENDKGVDHVVVDHLWDSCYRVEQWTMWLWTTSGIPATVVGHSC